MSSLQNILERLETTNKETTTSRILSCYEKEGYAIAHFLYFATIVFQHLDSNANTEEEKEYIEALHSSHFLLPDGVALQLLYLKHIKKLPYGLLMGLLYPHFTKRSIPNLNGTDYVPYFLSTLDKAQTNVILYGAKSETVTNAAKRLKDQGYHVCYYQDGYSEFDWGKINNLPKGINIFLVGKGSPRQEIWLEANRGKLQKYRLCAFSVGGLFDFWGGAEKRAPELFRKLKLEWLFRLLSNPKKNFKKVMVSFQIFWYLIK